MVLRAGWAAGGRRTVIARTRGNTIPIDRIAICLFFIAGLLLPHAALVQAAAACPSLTGRLPDHRPVLRPLPSAAPRPGDPPAGETPGCASAQGAEAAPGSPRPAHGSAPVDVSSGPPGRPGTRPRRSGG